MNYHLPFKHQNQSWLNKDGRRYFIYTNIYLKENWQISDFEFWGTQLIAFYRVCHIHVKKYYICVYNLSFFTFKKVIIQYLTILKNHNELTIKYTEKRVVGYNSTIWRKIIFLLLNSSDSGHIYLLRKLIPEMK